MGRADEAVRPLDAWVAGLTGLPEGDAAALTAWQLARLREVVRGAQAQSPFYAAHLAGVDPGGIKTPDDLARLPFTDAAMLTEQGTAMLCVGLDEVARIRTLPTSGSTGAPKRVWFTEGDMARTVDFFAVGMGALVPRGETVAVMMGSHRPGSIADLLGRGLARMGAAARCCPHEWDLAALAGPQGVAGAWCVVGSPARLRYLSHHHPQLRPKTVLLSADYIPPAVAEGLERMWGCRVFAHYGLTESCYGLAVQCAARRGQHLRAADFYVEIADVDTGAVLPPGAAGEIVLTALRSEALPLIRYRTGDIGSLAPGPCACGSVLPRLGRVLGRAANLARRVNIHRLDDVLFALPGLAGYTARWAGPALALQVEGTLPDTDALARRLGVPVQAVQGPASPFGGQAKRSIEGEPPWEG